MRFLEKQELANFNFQKDFLKPFEYAMLHNKNPEARDMILQCMQQMIQARVDNLRSGWRTMFGVFCAASKVNTGMRCSMMGLHSQGTNCWTTPHTHGTNRARCESGL